MKTGKALFFAPSIFFVLLQITMLAALGLTSVVPSASSAEKQTIADLAAIITPLVSQADLIVRGQVLQSNSGWNRAHTLIETKYQLAVHYTLLGKTSPELLIHTDGGFLSAEGLGMLSSHVAGFSVGEEVLLFLQKTDASYSVVEGEAGKFSVIQQEAVSDYYSQHPTLEQMVRQILAIATSQGRQINLSSNWRSAEPIGSIAMVSTSNQLWIDPKWPGTAPKIKVKVNLNSSHIGDQGGSAEVFLTAIKNALRTWSVVEVAELTLLYDGDTTATSTGFNTKNEILFIPKGANSQVGQAQIWFTASGAIVEADIWLNDDYQLDATGAPQADEIDLESVALHELGHWLPLAHTTNGSDVMYPTLGAGQRKITLNSDDIANLATLYPCPLVPCIDPAYADSSTPQPTATVITTTTPTNTPTPISTATATPTLSATSTITVTPTLVPSAVTPTPGMDVFLPIVKR